tara:strand:+ start:1274 stop:2692 length:1419 start_codon:yes stop_codon:yes gene_type:complete
VTLPSEFHSHVLPKKVASPKLAIFNHDLSTELGINFSSLQPEEISNLLSGNIIPDGSSLIAQSYAGHQFGHFTILGDGRAILLGEHILGDERFDIQFKGSGPTPYSRSGDGLAAIGPMLREYLISEAMYHLNIPTCRSLAVVETGEDVIREQKYPGAILTRISRSHIRIGTFQFAVIQEDKSLVKKLFNYTIERHFPNLIESKNKALDFLYLIIDQQAELITNWMRVGFIHGVMNTDNVALSGETIDYGPCAFMDHYDPLTVFSSIDHQGRYSFANQPIIAQWNLARLAETILPLISDNNEKALKLAEEAINAFADLYQIKWLDMMRRKIGLITKKNEDKDLISELLDAMQKHKADFTNTFRFLSEDVLSGDDIFKTEEFLTWYKKWKLRLKKESNTFENIKKIMDTNNPRVIPRNHLVEKALKSAEEGDLETIVDFSKIIKNPYSSSIDVPKKYLNPPNDNEKVLQTFCGT